MLSCSEKQTLLAFARATLEASLNDLPLPSPETVTEIRRTHCGAFVTLKLHGDLRGCIGYIESEMPLTETVQEVALKAAFEDPRFVPIELADLHNIDIEISVLSPIREITDISQIEIGKHGLIIQKGLRRGLLLPQVATEYEWDRQTFLAHTARKAGLQADAWQQPETTISIFSADVFSENEIRNT